MSSLLTPAMASYGYTVKDGQLVAPPNTTTTDNGTLGKTDIFEKYLQKAKDFMPKPESKTELYKKTYGMTPEEARIKANSAENLVKTYTNQINEINSKATADKLQLRQTGSQEGVTEPVYGGQASEIDRNAAIQTLRVAPLLSAAQGDYETAQKHVDDYFKILSDDADSQYKYQIDLYNTAFSYADKEEQRQLQEKANQKTVNHSDLQAAISDANSVASTALANGQGNIYESITTIPKPSILSSTFEQDLANYNAKVATLARQIAPRATQTEKDQAEISSINSKLNNARGVDGYTDPNLYSKLRATSDISPNEFDNRFGNLVNPESRPKLGLQSTVNKSDLTPEQTSIINDAKAAIDQVKQRYGDWGATRQQIIDQAKTQYNFDISPYI
jgi:hypothetical protein